MRPASSSVRRARPLLGTFVEITVTGGSAAAMHTAVDEAFDAVATVHRLMSFHDAASDVSRLNRRAVTAAIRVHPWTYEVLQAAGDLHRRSHGVFDVTIAPTLQALGLLPGEHDDLPSPAPSGAGAAIELLSDFHVRFAHPGVRIDLGGIAKGFAVDRAVEVLRRAAMESGLVNAGGDLRGFGADGHRVHLRDPGDPRRLVGVLTLTDGALATTGGRFDPFAGAGAGRSPVIDPRRPWAAPAVLGVTVRAPSCTLADALTKVVMLEGERALRVLDRYDADALFWSPAGALTITSDWAEALQPAA